MSEKVSTTYRFAQHIELNNSYLYLPFPTESDTNEMDLNDFDWKPPKLKTKNRESEFFQDNAMQASAPPENKIGQSKGRNFLSFFSFLSLSSVEKQKPENSPLSTAPTCKSPPHNASILLPHYLRTDDANKLEKYLKENNISVLDLADLRLAKSLLTVAAEQGKANFTEKLLPYVKLENAIDTLNTLACLPTHERDHTGIMNCAKLLAAHIQNTGDFANLLRLNEAANFSPEQINWLREMGRR
ncbi:hypothetical protein KTQ42_00215|uniref:hypothetical protein n=1 Tax=Noviherbaspirillum sp. L7-7A TaxID=2850560 RepID=UPI001C2C0FD0|nr:hypothetical protein [Noviherbaspirillum sp. L7-7A]MBV0877728.1 hypothetical protein [Noviherbaspirillum sp. L7-7A]